MRRETWVFVGVLWMAAMAAWVVTVRAQTPAAPALTEIDQLRIEKVNLMKQLAAALHEADACRGALAEPRATMNGQQIQAAEAQLQADVEKAHPGFSWDPHSGTFTPRPPTK